MNVADLFEQATGPTEMGSHAPTEMGSHAPSMPPTESGSCELAPPVTDII